MLTKCGHIQSCLGFFASDASRKAIYFGSQAATPLVLSAAIVSRFVGLCLRPNAGNQNTIFSTKRVLSNPTNNQLHLCSDYSGLSSGGCNGLDLHSIAKWNRLLPHRVFIQPIWQLYCLKNSKKGGCCEIPPCRGSLNCSLPSRLHQPQRWECGSHSSPNRQQWI